MVCTLSNSKRHPTAFAKMLDDYSALYSVNERTTFAGKQSICLMQVIK